ncbi:MAG: hypothetical protein WD492_14095 [Alkalispirochaeta sp.]
MSIFRSNPQSSDLSALLDNELPPRSARMLEDALQNGTRAPHEFDRIEKIHSFLTSQETSAEEIAAAQERVRVRLDRSIRAVHHRDQRPWWERSVTIPMPVMATAMVAVMMFAVILASRIAAPGASGSPQQTAGTIADRAESVNVQVNVNGDQTEQLLRWLNDRNSVETVTIQLPDTAQFQLRGKPVFMRPELPGERASEPTADDTFAITPLEDPEE